MNNARSWKMWLKLLIGAAVGGAANSLLSVAGIAGANQVGMNIQQFTPKQFGAMCVSGAIVGAAMYLKKSPLPGVNENDNTNQNP